MKKEIRNCLVWIVNRLSEEYVWNLESRNKNNFNMFYEELEKYIDLEKITVEEAKELRFQRWDEELPDLWLFPLWIVPLIPEGLEVMDIGGNKYKYKAEEADNDIRFGCVSYGIEIKE